jgi:hypothetical protein
MAGVAAAPTPIRSQSIEFRANRCNAAGQGDHPEQSARKIA